MSWWRAAVPRRRGGDGGDVGRARVQQCSAGGRLHPRVARCSWPWDHRSGRRQGRRRLLLAARRMWSLLAVLLYGLDPQLRQGRCWRVDLGRMRRDESLLLLQSRAREVRLEISPAPVPLWAGRNDLQEGGHHARREAQGGLAHAFRGQGFQQGVSKHLTCSARAASLRWTSCSKRVVSSARLEELLAVAAT